MRKPKCKLRWELSRELNPMWTEGGDLLCGEKESVLNWMWTDGKVESVLNIKIYMWDSECEKV